MAQINWQKVAEDNDVTQLEFSEQVSKLIINNAIAVMERDRIDRVVISASPEYTLTVQKRVK